MLSSNYNNIELRHFRYFAAVAEELHFGRAAERLFITQPTLSRQIQDLEKHIEVTLFKRTKRSVALTQAGQYLYDEVTALFDNIDKVIYKARQIEQGLQGEITLSITSASLNVIVPSLVRKFHIQFPKININFLQRSSDQQITLLLNKQVDFAFHHTKGDSDLLNSVLIKKEKLGVVLPIEHPLNNETSLTLEMLKNEPWILFPKTKNPLFYDSILQTFNQAGYEPNVTLEISPRQNAISLVSAGFGITFLSPSLKHSCTNISNVVFKPLLGIVPEINYYVSWNPENESPPVSHFVELVREKIKQ